LDEDEQEVLGQIQQLNVEELEETQIRIAK
jgi:hypothetical protein